MRVFAGVCMLLGCFLGAGFVSGREVASYFSRFGNQSIWAVIIATILLFLLILFFLMLSNKTKNFSEFSQFYFGKLNNIADFLMAICVLIITSSMFAGTMSLSETFNINKFVFVGITLVLAFFIVIGNTHSLSKVNIILMPFLILIVLIATYVKGVNNSFDGSIILAVASGSNYVFINIVSIGLFLLEIGHKYTIKEKVLISIISSLVIGIMLIVINNAILNNMLIDEVFPNLTLAKNNKILYICMQLSIFFGLFTTLISNVFILSNYINKFIKHYRISVLVSLIMGLIFSFLGFQTMVGYIYWFIGFIGVIMIFFVIFKEKRIGRKPYS
ncbi:MAG: hypothetical protein ACI4PF_00265 [Christensenellales bacterium]